MLGLRLLSAQSCVSPLIRSNLGLGTGSSLPAFNQSEFQKYETPIGTRCKSKKKSKSQSDVSFRTPSPCTWLLGPDRKPCFDINNVLVERATMCHEKLIRSFLYTHYWPREPSCAGLWMPIDSPLLAVLTEKYCTSGDRFVAFEYQERTGERKLIGVLVAYKTFPWVAEELEEWALHTALKPEQHRMLFMAHCLRSPNLFEKYNVEFIYDLEVLVTATDVGGHGVGKKLVQFALADATEMRYPLTQLVAKNIFAAKICSRCGMKEDWSMAYSDFIDNMGKSVFYPRKPHYTVSIFTKKFQLK